MAEVVIYTWRWGYQKGSGCSLSFSLRETSYHYCELFWNQCGKKLVSQASVQESQCLIVTMGASLCWHLQFYLWSILSPNNQKFKKKKMKPQETTVFILKTPLSLQLFTPLTAHLISFYVLLNAIHHYCIFKTLPGSWKNIPLHQQPFILFLTWFLLSCQG